MNTPGVGDFRPRVPPPVDKSTKPKVPPPVDKSTKPGKKLGVGSPQSAQTSDVVKHAFEEKPATQSLHRTLSGHAKKMHPDISFTCKESTKSKRLSPADVKQADRELRDLSKSYTDNLKTAKNNLLTSNPGHEGAEVINDMKQYVKTMKGTYQEVLDSSDAARTTKEMHSAAVAQGIKELEGAIDEFQSKVDEHLGAQARKQSPKVAAKTTIVEQKTLQLDKEAKRERQVANRDKVWEQQRQADKLETELRFAAGGKGARDVKKLFEIPDKESPEYLQLRKKHDDYLKSTTGPGKDYQLGLKLGRAIEEPREKLIEECVRYEDFLNNAVDSMRQIHAVVTGGGKVMKDQLANLKKRGENAIKTTTEEIQHLIDTLPVSIADKEAAVKRMASAIGILQRMLDELRA